MARSQSGPRSVRKRSLAMAIVVARMRREQAQDSSVSAFAKTVGISEGTYNLLAAGSANPTIGTLEKIAAGLGLSFYELIGNIDANLLRKRLAMVGLDLDALAKSVERLDAAAAEFTSAIGDEAAPAKRKRKRAPPGTIDAPPKRGRAWRAT